MNEALCELIGNEVEVRSTSGQANYEDTGVLEAFDYPWVRLRKSEKEILCFPVHNVRLVKLVRRLRQPPQDEVLLRPASHEGRPVCPPD